MYTYIYIYIYTYTYTYIYTSIHSIASERWRSTDFPREWHPWACGAGGSEGWWGVTSQVSGEQAFMSPKGGGNVTKVMESGIPVRATCFYTFLYMGASKRLRCRTLKVWFQLGFQTLVPSKTWIDDVVHSAIRRYAVRMPNRTERIHEIRWNQDFHKLVYCVYCCMTKHSLRYLLLIVVPPGFRIDTPW